MVDKEPQGLMVETKRFNGEVIVGMQGLIVRPQDMMVGSQGFMLGSWVFIVGPKGMSVGHNYLFGLVVVKHGLIVELWF